MGFSYGKRKIDEVHKDYNYERDAVEFVKSFFFKGWPELINNPLYISGISYGGVYAPRLALAIHYFNQEQTMAGDPRINLKGLIISNGFTNYESDAVTVEVLASFNLIPLSQLEDYKEKKCFVPWELF